MPPEWYVRLPACRVCGSRSYRVDEHRARVGRGGANNEVCNCGNYFNENGAWPHRKGVGACAHNPTLTEEDFMAIQAQLRARRRG